MEMQWLQVNLYFTIRWQAVKTVVNSVGNTVILYAQKIFNSRKIAIVNDFYAGYFLVFHFPNFPFLQPIKVYLYIISYPQGDNNIHKYETRTK